MNDSNKINTDQETLTELKIVVERAVRPVRASLARKRGMREELLEHLTMIFEEELSRADSEQATLKQAAKRFGDTGKLSQELQGSVTLLNRFFRWDENFRLELGESLPHYFCKVVLTTAVIYPLMFLPMLLLTNLIGKPMVYGFSFQLLGVMAVVSTSLTVALVFSSNKVCRSLYGIRTQASRRRAILISLATLPLFPGLLFLTYLGLALSVPPPQTMTLALILAPLAPILVYLLARIAEPEMRHEAEWAELELES